MKFSKTNPNELQDLKQDYLKHIKVPLDDMWENLIIPSGIHYRIGDKGFLVLDQENTLFQFHLKEAYLFEAQEIFAAVLEHFEIKEALVATYETNYMSLVLSKAKIEQTHTLLYKGVPSPVIEAPLKDISIATAKSNDFDKVIEFCTEKVGISGPWMTPYYENLLPQGAIKLFHIDRELVGIGELRPSSSSPEYANVGFMVSKDWRKKGLGSYIMNQLKNNKEGLKCICSTTVDNIGAQKGIHNSGFFPYHRILKFNF